MTLKNAQKTENRNKMKTKIYLKKITIIITVKA